jgi:hypothetical protein
MVDASMPVRAPGLLGCSAGDGDVDCDVDGDSDGDVGRSDQAADICDSTGCSSARFDS